MRINREVLGSGGWGVELGGGGGLEFGFEAEVRVSALNTWRLGGPGLVGNGSMVVIVVIIVPHSSIPY